MATKKHAHSTALRDAPVRVSMILGRTELTLDQLMCLGADSTIDIDKLAGEPVDILLNGKLHGRGQVVTVGEHLGVRVTELVDR